MVSTIGGIRWTAAYRTGALLTFQLPGTSSASSGSSSTEDGLAEAVEHWREQLERWSADPYVGLPVALEADAREPAPAGPADGAGELLAMVSAVLHRLDDLAQRLDTGCSETRQLALRFDRIERRLAELVDRERSDGSPSATAGSEARADVPE